MNLKNINYSYIYNNENFENSSLIKKIIEKTTKSKESKEVKETKKINVFCKTTDFGNGSQMIHQK